MTIPAVEREIREAFLGWRRSEPHASVESVAQALREDKKWVAQFDPRGERIEVVALVREGEHQRLHSFTLLYAVADPGEPGQAAREVAARRDQEDLLIRGVADALELGYSLKTAREQLRARCGPDNVLYDAIELGTRTFRELLELHTRANRSLLTALRRLTPSGAAVRQTEEVVLRPGHRGREYHGSLVLENRCNREIRLEMPGGVHLCGPDGVTTHWLDLRSDPAVLTLLRNDRRTVVLTTELRDDELAVGKYHGELVLGTPEGDFTRAALTLVKEG